MKAARIFGMIFAGLALGGCASAVRDGSAAGNLAASVTDAVTPGTREQYQAQIDDTKCREFGYEPKSKSYGDCRLELARIRGRE